MSGFLENLKSSVNPKFLWSVAAIFIVINMGFGIVNGLFSSHTINGQITQHYAKIAEARAKVLSEPVWVFEYERAKKLLSELVVNEEIVKASVNVDNETLSAAQKNPPWSGTKTVTFPIVFKDDSIEQSLGQFTMTYSTGKASGVMLRRVTESIIISLILVMIVAFITQQNQRPEEESAA